MEYIIVPDTAIIAINRGINNNEASGIIYRKDNGERHIIDFEDYSESDLYEICIDTIKNKGFNLTDEANNYLKQVIYELYNDNNLSLKNGLMIKSYLDRLVRVQSVRVYNEKVSTKELNTIEKIDIEISKKQFIDKRRINLKTMF